MSDPKDVFWDRDLAQLVCVSRLKSLVAFMEIDSRYAPLSPLLQAGLADAKAAIQELDAAQAKVEAQRDLDFENAKKWLSSNSTTELSVIEGGNNPGPRSA